MLQELPEASGASFETPLKRLLRMRAEGLGLLFPPHSTQVEMPGTTAMMTRPASSAIR
jgi:hypothetical protein